MEAMKTSGEMIEGPEAFERFRNAVKAVLAVPHSVIQKRVEQHRREAANNPNRPGPKPQHPAASESGRKKRAAKKHA
jgi:hypothetical protein